MNYIIKKKKLELRHVPGKGAWTYHLKIPGTRDIEGKWGDIKVSGSIDNYVLQCRNLAPTKGEDKILSINGAIRRAINKSGGDLVTVTLYLLDKNEKVDEKQVLDSFRESCLLDKFEKLDKDAQAEILSSILGQATEEKKVNRIVYFIKKLGK